MDSLVVHSNELKGKDKIKLANEQMKKMFDVERSKCDEWPQLPPRLRHPSFGGVPEGRGGIIS